MFNIQTQIMFQSNDVIFSDDFATVEVATDKISNVLHGYYQKPLCAAVYGEHKAAAAP